MTLTLKRPRFLSYLTRLASLGLVGVVSSYPLIHKLVEKTLQNPGLSSNIPAGMSTGTLTAVALINPALLTLGSTVLGAVLAPKVGLHSVLSGQSGARFTRQDAGAGVLTGVTTAVLLMGLDRLTRPLLGEAAAQLNLDAPRSLTDTLAGMLYGGITEELLLRWGAMTLLAWLGWRFLQRDGQPPRSAVMWGAITVAAVLFGLGHLGAVAALVNLTPAVVSRTILLNMIGGMAFGYLYWRRNLETAMLAHACWHVTVTLIGLLK